MNQITVFYQPQSIGDVQQKEVAILSFRSPSGILWKTFHRNHSMDGRFSTEFYVGKDVKTSWRPVVFHGSSTEYETGTSKMQDCCLTWWWQDRGDSVIETILFVRRVSATSFRAYSVQAENQLGLTTHSARLVQSKSHTSVNQGRGNCGFRLFSQKLHRYIQNFAA